MQIQQKTRVLIISLHTRSVSYYAWLNGGGGECCQKSHNMLFLTRTSSPSFELLKEDLERNWSRITLSPPIRLERLMEDIQTSVRIPHPLRLELFMQDLHDTQNTTTQDWNFLWRTLCQRLMCGDYRCIPMDNVSFHSLMWRLQPYFFSEKHSTCMFNVHIKIMI